jgi:hypothetical protein
MITSPVEVFWLTLSLLSLDADEQQEIIGRGSESGHLQRSNTYNPLSAVVSTFHEYYLYWHDEFYPNVKLISELECYILEVGVFVAPSKGIYTISELREGKAWNRFRELARASLLEAGMPLYPMPSHIDFSEYIEIGNDV